MVINLDQDPFACEANATVANPSELEKNLYIKYYLLIMIIMYFFTSFRRMPVRSGQHLGNNMA